MVFIQFHTVRVIQNTPSCQELGQKVIWRGHRFDRTNELASPPTPKDSADSSVAIELLDAIFESILRGKRGFDIHSCTST